MSEEEKNTNEMKVQNEELQALILAMNQLQDTVKGLSEKLGMNTSDEKDTGESKKLVKYNKYVKAIAEALNSNKKMNAKKEEAYYVVDVILRAIDEFNKLPADTTWFSNWTKNLEEITIISEFKDFLLPDSIRYDANDRLTKDVLDRDKRETYSDRENCPSEDEFVNALSRYRGFTRDDAKHDLVTISSLRMKLNLFDIIDKAVLADNGKGGKVKRGDMSFIPVRVTINLSNLFENGYANDNFEHIMADYIRDKFA